MKTNTLISLTILTVMLCISLFKPAAAAESSLVRSAIFPGIGQLGNGQTAKGLLYMFGEVALLTLTIDNIAKAASTARGTAYDSVSIYHEGGYAVDRTQQINDWQNRADTHDRAKIMALSFGGLAVAWWAWNIVDGIIFVPQDSDEMSLLNKAKRNTMLSVGPDGAQIHYSLDF
jgi:hypothetical protein